jgi:hypothetical protein
MQQANTVFYKFLLTRLTKRLKSRSLNMLTWKTISSRLQAYNSSCRDEMEEHDLQSTDFIRIYTNRGSRWIQTHIHKLRWFRKNAGCLYGVYATRREIRKGAIELVLTFSLKSLCYQGQDSLIILHSSSSCTFVECLLCSVFCVCNTLNEPNAHIQSFPSYVPALLQGGASS